MAYNKVELVKLNVKKKPFDFVNDVIFKSVLWLFSIFILSA